jgi:hypothetical protein
MQVLNLLQKKADNQDDKDCKLNPKQWKLICFLINFVQHRLPIVLTSFLVFISFSLHLLLFILSVKSKENFSLLLITICTLFHFVCFSISTGFGYFANILLNCYILLLAFYMNCRFKYVLNLLERLRIQKPKSTHQIYLKSRQVQNACQLFDYAVLDLLRINLMTKSISTINFIGNY